MDSSARNKWQVRLAVLVGRQRGLVRQLCLAVRLLDVRAGQLEDHGVRLDDRAAVVRR